MEENKMSENYYLLDDMEKYDITFNRKAYEHLSVKELIPIFKDHYNKHLPIDVTTWIRVNEPDENLIYKKGLGKQVCTIRDTIMRDIFYHSIFKEYDNKLYDEFQPMVINTHRSKSVLLPVMLLNIEKYNIKIIVRENFYDWKISIISKDDINCDFKGLFTENDKPINSVYCEGFPENLVFDRYCDNKKQFTIEIGDDYRLYTFMYLLNDYFYNKK
jgi:hypothetical protein